MQTTNRPAKIPSTHVTQPYILNYIFNLFFWLYDITLQKRSHSLPMISWCKSPVCAVYFCPADCSCTLCGASDVTSPASGWWTHSLFCWLLSLCPVSSPASCCVIFSQTTWTDGQSVTPENFPDDSFLLCFLSPFYFIRLYRSEYGVHSFQFSSEKAWGDSQSLLQGIWLHI